MSFVAAAAGVLPYAGVQLVVAGFAQAHSQLRRFTAGLAAFNQDLSQIPNQSDRLAAAQDVMRRSTYTLWYMTSILGTALMGAGVAAGTQAAQLETLTLASDALTKAQSRAAGELDQAVERIRAQSYTYAEAREQVNKYAISQRDAGEAVRLAAIANDLAVLKGRSAVEMLDALTQAVVNGNAETLTTLGLGERAEAVMEREARALGKKADELTHAERQQAVYNYILERSASFQGAFEASAGSAARAVRDLRVEVNDLATSYGQALLPLFTEAVDTATRFIHTLNELPDSTKEILAYIDAWVAVSLAIVGSILAISKVAGIVIAAAKALAGALSVIFMTTVSVGAVLTGLGAVVGVVGVAVALYALYQRHAKRATEEHASAVQWLTAEMQAYAALATGLAKLSGRGPDPTVRSLERGIAQAKKELKASEGAARGLESALRAVEQRIWAMDDALQPFKDSLRRIEAQVALTTIPWERELRQLRWLREDLAQMAEDEEERLDAFLDGLAKQREEMERLLDLDRERLELIDHQLFIENLRNKIIGREGSLRALTLRSQRMAQEDVVAAREQEVKAAREQEQLEKDRVEALKDAADQQLAALDRQISVLQRMVDMEEEKVTRAREDLQIAEAHQVEERIAAEAEQRHLQRAQQAQSALVSTAQRKVQALEDALERYQEIMEKRREYLKIEEQVLKLYEEHRKAMARIREEMEKAAEAREAELEAERQRGPTPSPAPTPPPVQPPQVPPPSGTPTPPGSTPIPPPAPTPVPPPPVVATPTPPPARTETPSPEDLLGTRSVPGVSAPGTPTAPVVTERGTTIQIDAHYAESQSPIQVADDVRLAAQMVM